MRKKIGISIALVLILLLAIVVYHRFQVQTKRVFFALFPIFAYASVEQPILFNHPVHKEKANLDCTFCHRYVEKHRVAGIPNIDLCRACHSTDALSKRAEALKVVRYVQTGRPIPWKRMYEMPKFVVFPHWIHIQSGVDCAVCHGLTGSKERPVKMIDRNDMEWCLDCHRQRNASIDCYACHSS